MTPKDDDIEYELVSKTEMKREMQRYQELGEVLCDMPPAKWAALPISGTLMAALEESKRIKKHEARRRHFQYIGKVMRSEDLDALQEAIDMLDPSSDAFGRKIRQLEQWRTRLIDGDEGMNEFLEAYPDTDRQQLRNMIRNARKEMQADPPKPGTAFKKLFQLIKDIDNNH